jgi:two-component system, sensor histidine kinase and response regulator
VERTGVQVQLRFSVADTGIGIPTSKLGHVFERFTQADTSTTRQYGGTGLGLSISKQLVDLTGGKMGVESKIGEGSRFWFILPFPVDLTPLDTAPVDRDMSGVRVLLVDDNPTNLFVLREQLNGWGLRNDSSSGAEDALNLLRAAQRAGDPYQIAMLDHQMPIIDGEQLARTIKADAELKNTVLVLLTSIGVRGDAARMKKAGFSAYLIKPAREAELLNTLINLWANWRPAPSGPVVAPHLVPDGSGTFSPGESIRPVFRARVLIVEDNAVNQMVAARLLENMGCRVDVAADAMQGDRERCLDAGMDDYVSKPIRKADLIEALNRHLSKNVKPIEAKAELEKM